MISETELRVMAEVQRLPLVPEPFAEAADRLGMSEDDVIKVCRDLLDKGAIRRFGPSLSHRKFGFGANPMCVLKVPDEEERERVGKIIAEHPRVTHAYARSGWDYDIFFMVHGKTKEEAVQVAEEIVAGTGVADYKFLFSTRELKKISFEIPREGYK